MLNAYKKDDWVIIRPSPQSPEAIRQTGAIARIVQPYPREAHVRFVRLSELGWGPHRDLWWYYETHPGHQRKSELWCETLFIWRPVR